MTRENLPLPDEPDGRGKAERAFAASEEQFRMLVTGVKDYAIFMLDPAGRVVTWNAGAERIKQYRAEEILGEHFSRFYPPEDLGSGKVERELAIAASEGKFEEEGWRVRKDGSRFWASVVLTSLFDEQGKLRGYAKITRDLTERRESERIRSIVDNVADGIITFDEVGTIASVNPAGRSIFGYSEEELQGKNIRLLACHLEPDSWSNQTESTSVVRSMTGCRKDGSEFAMDVSVGAFHFLGRRAFTAVVRDTTDRRRLEDELQRRVNELAITDKRKDEFLAMLAHELRNPLAPIKNSLHILKVKQGDWNVVANVRAMMERQVTHLHRLVDDLLDVGRITQGKVKLKLERIDFASVIRDCVQDRKSDFDAAKLHLGLDVPPAPIWVNGDSTRLTQVVENFLTNALKFTNAGGDVFVRVWADAKHARLSVTDTGIGIEPETLPTIFDVFAQADKTLDRSRGGMGLGLAVVKGLIGLHGGSVEARSEGLGHGAEMRVELPLESDAPTVQESKQPHRPSAQRRRVLIIEDNIDSAATLRLLLEVSGFEVQLAHTGPAGIQAARAWKPEVVVCDIGLPIMDGFVVAQTLRADAATKHLRLVALTGYGQKEDVIRAREAGFDDHIVKPADPEVLLAALAK